MKMQFTNFSMVTDMYKIAYLNDEGEWQIVRSCYTYHQADLLLDKYTDKYPNTLVEILCPGD